MDAQGEFVLRLVLSELSINPDGPLSADSAATVEGVQSRVEAAMQELDPDDLNHSAWQVSETILAEFSARRG